MFEICDIPLSVIFVQHIDKNFKLLCGKYNISEFVNLSQPIKFIYVKGCVFRYIKFDTLTHEAKLRNCKRKREIFSKLDNKKH